MKHFILIILIALNFNVFSQEADKTVTLVVSGSGKTQDEAKQNALRSAIEQAFGTFISSKTEILNDNLVKDEIVSVSNGNIQKFDIISETQIPEGGYATTLNATVSVTKLTSFVESKGLEVELKGSLFAMNIKLQKLNEGAEYKSVLNLCEVSREMLSKSIDYSLNVGDPIAYNVSNDEFLVNLNVECKDNINMKIFYDYFHKTLSGISMNKEDIENYNKLKKVISYVLIYDGSSKYKRDTLCLRNPNSILALKNLMIKSNDFLFNFRIKSEVDTILVNKCCNVNYRGDSYNPGTGNSDPHQIDKWYITSKVIGWGFPSAGKIKVDYLSKSDKGFNKNDIYSTGKMYIEALATTKHPDILSEDSIYYTTTNFDLSSYGVRGEFGGGTWQYWLNNVGGSNIDEPLHFFKSPSYLFSFSNQHLLKIQMLEKITKYVIEPYENK